MKDDETDIAAAFRVHAGGKQTEMPGIGRAYDDVEKAAEDLRVAEAACKAATDLKADRAERLIYALIDKGEKVYRYTDSEGLKHTIRLSNKTSVKITRGWSE